MNQTDQVIETIARCHRELKKLTAQQEAVTNEFAWHMLAQKIALVEEDLRCASSILHMLERDEEEGFGGDAA